MNIQEHIKSLEIPYRGDCPYCHNKNTFVANLVDGQVLYYCYHVNCKLKGKLNYNLKLEDIKNVGNVLYRSDSRFNSDRGTYTTPFIVPNHWQNPLQNKRCYNFLKYWNILDVYIDKKVNIFYDPKQERCVFLIKDLKGNIKGATGRSLYNAYPKWYIYDRLGSCPGILLSDSEQTFAILVEDFISACVASRIFNSVVLLGTNISLDCIAYLKHFKLVFIALDKDATSKSLKLQHQLAPYIKSIIISLDNDIKYFKKEQLEELKRNVSSYL